MSTTPILDSAGRRRAGSARTLPARLKPRAPDDRDLIALRRATRAAIIIPSAFACAKLLTGDLQLTTFVAFGCFALLVMADFGGTRRPRAVAYVAAVLVGAALIVLGTLASPVPVLGALLMLLVGFCIQFAGVFGGYVAASQTALQLSFVLSVSIPASAGAVGPRLLGWLGAGVVSTVSGVYLWPWFERLHLRTTAAEACRELARFLKAQPLGSDDRQRAQALESAQRAVTAARQRYTATPKRPAGPARRDRAFAELLTEMERTLHVATHPFRLHQSPVYPRLDEDEGLMAAIVRTLDASADVLTGGTPPDLLQLNRARDAQREALDRWARDSLRAGMAPEEVLAGLDVDHKLRVLSYLALAIGTNATIAAGAQVGAQLDLPAGTPREGGIRPLVRILRTVRTHLNPTSNVLHQSVRVGLGLALAVLLARLLHLDHAFWVVLGTLTVLRSNAFGTGRTTLEALIGTVSGFAVGALFTLLVGPTSPVLWVALPVAVFLATYAASAISFVVGQAAFTVLLIILFNLISPAGWRVGLVRLEDVALGVGISVITGLLLWPRGARGELVAAVASFYRALASYLAGSFAHVLEPGIPQTPDGQRVIAVRAADRAGEAFDQFLQERGAKPIDPGIAASLVAAGANAITVGDLLRMVANMGYQVQDASSDAPELRAQTQLMIAGFLRLADQLDGTAGAFLGGVLVSDDVLREVSLTYLRHWRDDPVMGRSALAAVIAAEWLQQLGELTTDLEGPVAGVVEAAHLPWWL